MLFYFGRLGFSKTTFASPLTQVNGLVNRSQSNKYSQNCSSESSVYLTNKIIRKQKPLNKLTVPLALQDGYASKSEDDIIVSTSFVDVLNKKFNALYRLTRPYTWASIVSYFNDMRFIS